MSLLFGFINANKKRRLNRPKNESLFTPKNKRKLSFSGSYALPERIKLYEVIHKHVREGALKMREYEKASEALGFKTITNVQRGYNLWLESGGGKHE